MNTPACDAATRVDIALGAPAKEAMHKRCPGAYRTPQGELKACGCECHGAVDLDSLKDTALPVLDGERVIAPGGDHHPRKRPKKAPKGTCECGCGAPVRARFLPGHDAKLKSALLKAARAGDQKARDDLYSRGWLKFL